MRKQAPKDVNNQLGSAMGLDPNDPNDMAFKLVTIFFVSQKLTFFYNITTPPPPCHLSLSRRFLLRHFCIGVGIIGEVV